jgi:cytochrome c peroxidase
LQRSSSPESTEILPALAFADLENIETGTPVSRGSIDGRTGGLNTPSAGYAAFSPDFHWDDEEGLYVGGLFWNGRAATLQAQAEQPFLNPNEMAMPSKWAVVARIKENSTYQTLFSEVFGIDLEAVPASDSASTNDMPPQIVLDAYAAAAQAISQFERGTNFNQFTSKFDFWLAGKTSLTSAELSGLDLFNNKAGCAACHISESSRDANGKTIPPLFTDFTFDNIGLPQNLKIPGTPEPDHGLGGRAEILAKMGGADEIGKHKVMSHRNIAITPPYGHNGVFSNLEQIVHFYNTRDFLGEVQSNLSDGFGVTGWPKPEVLENVNRDELGDLGLTDEEEADLVAFMNTLTDNYPETGNDPAVPPKTPSPFANVPIPPIPTTLDVSAPGEILLSGRVGKTFRIQSCDSLTNPQWVNVTEVRLPRINYRQIDTNGLATARYYRAVQLP